MVVLRAVLVSLAVTGLSGCARSTAARPPQVAFWILPAATIPRDSATPTGVMSEQVGALVTIDTTSLRPVIARKAGSGFVEARVSDSVWYEMHLLLPAVITTFQGNRYHPETLRALANDTVVLADFARGLVLGTVRDKRVILDFQSSTPEDLPELVSVARAIGTLARIRHPRSLSIVVPAGDTVAYPTLVLARVADWLIVRLQGEHRPGTAPGPLVTPEFAARAIGMRAGLIGASRIAVELPLYGYRWNRDGSAIPITWSEAQALVLSESGAFTRDPPSQFLTARGRDGWTVWVPDARTILFLVGEVRRRGIGAVHLAGPEGGDPHVLTALRTAY